MSETVRLIPMYCLNCQSPIEAQPDEIAWACEQCGQGLLISNEQGFQALEIHYSAALQPGTPGRPFWVPQGAVSLTRATFAGNESASMNAFWSAPRPFFIPAYRLPWVDAVNLGATLLKNPPQCLDGSRQTFMPVTVSPADVRPLMEFIILAIEAERKDALKTLELSLQMIDLQLWILP